MEEKYMSNDKVVCPYCGEKIGYKVMAKQLGQITGRLGGQASKRTITPEQQAKMQAARKERGII
jgi:DNA-directed RNA polymerase subunit RPC12/RpoP